MSADSSDSFRIATRMQQATRTLHSMAAMVGSAKTCREFNTEQRKAALSAEVVKALKDGESATAAEHIGRASDAYQARLAILMKQLEEAETVIAKHAAETCSFEAARSLLAMQRENLRQL